MDSAEIFALIFVILPIMLCCFVPMYIYLHNPKIGCLLVLAYVIISLLSPVVLYWDIDQNPFDYARITDVNYKAIVLDEPNNSGKVKVTERLTFDVHAVSKDNLYWELWRALPESVVDGCALGEFVVTVFGDEGLGSSKLYVFFSPVRVLLAICEKLFI